MRAEFAMEVNRWLYQIALGLQYLHGEHIVHGDLYGANILIDDMENVRLTDFGMSVVAEGTPNRCNSIHGGGALRWTAPELIDSENSENRRPNFRSDVYSFGCVGFELYSMQAPFSELSNDAAVLLRVLRGKRPSRPILPEGVSNEVWDLISWSWSQDPSRRPSVAELVISLEDMNLQETSSQHPGLQCLLPNAQMPLPANQQHQLSEAGPSVVPGTANGHAPAHRTRPGDEVQRVVHFITMVKNDYKHRVKTFRTLNVPEHERAEYNKAFKRFYRLVVTMDNEIYNFSSFTGKEGARRLIALITFAHHQQSLLSLNPPEYILNLKAVHSLSEQIRCTLLMQWQSYGLRSRLQSHWSFARRFCVS